MKMCQIITGSDNAVSLTQHKVIFTGCTAARKPLQSDFVLTRKHHIKSMGLFILLHASEAFRSDRPSSSLASLTVKNGKKLSFFRPDSKLQLQRSSRSYKKRFLYKNRATSILIMTLVPASQYLKIKKNKK